MRWAAVAVGGWQTRIVCQSPCAKETTSHQVAFCSHQCSATNKEYSWAQSKLAQARLFCRQPKKAQHITCEHYFGDKGGQTLKSQPVGDLTANYFSPCSFELTPHQTVRDLYLSFHRKDTWLFSFVHFWTKGVDELLSTRVLHVLFSFAPPPSCKWNI